ncbi:MAG: polysaccharide deacetylase family protein [Bacilli bacterium]|nr:polysaccharide deacetylase family protein [Bacilli bacterium]
MKKILEIIGIITLLIGSFMYNEKVSTTAKLSDSLLEEIKAKSKEYKIKPIEPIINEDTIIPGINGKTLNIKESYTKMKEIGYFNEKLLVYNEIKVKEILKNNKDKYIISGNKNKKEVSLVFIIDKTKNIKSLINTLHKEKIKATFFINSDYLEKNYNYIINLLKEGNSIGNLSKNRDYSDSDFVWMKTILTNNNYQKNNYCFTSEKNKEIINMCALQNSYTILGNIIKNPFIEIKENLSGGSIYIMNIDDKTNRELANIIKYIKSKGYKIKSLEKLLYE